MSRLAVVASLALACGDNLTAGGPALAPTAQLVVVAHPDDDLLLMQPDTLEAVQRGDGVTSVYVTAGNGREGGVETASRRIDGIKAAYAHAANASNWSCGVIDIAGHSAEHCRLSAKNISLVFLAYPDGGKEGEYPASLLRLWRGEISSAATIATQPTRYDRAGLITTLAQIIRETNASSIRTLEVAGTHGRDHPDHVIVGALAMLALAESGHVTDVHAYRGYAIDIEPPNKLTPVFDAALAMLAHYEACATGCAACGDRCTAVDESHATWLLRRYAIGFRRGVGGRLRINNQCVNDALVLVSCPAAPVWQLDGAGELRTLELCLTTDETGELRRETCTGGIDRRFFVDDEGHIFSGMPPAPDAQASDGFLWCLTPVGNRVRLERCSAARAPSWEFVPLTVETLRTDIQFTATGREVRLRDVTGDRKADLCTVGVGGLICAAGTGLGGFLPAVRIDDPVRPLTIDPRSLVLGDVDGDRKGDACGRDADGIVCATFAAKFAAEHWSPAFNDATALAGTSASLAAIDADADGIAELCGVDQSGVICAPRGATFQAQPRSTWPAADAVVWPADLDGDRHADWCASTDAGPACAVFAHSELTTDGSPWGYAREGVVDIAPATTATVVLADIDADGRADLCAPRNDRIVCARSQGRAFGPLTTTLAILPNQSTASALWIGDLNGDGRGDPCVDTGTMIVCSVQP